MNAALQQVYGFVNVNVNRNVQNAFALAAVDCKNPVRLHLVKRLGKIPVHLIGRSFRRAFFRLPFGNNALRLDAAGFNVQVMYGFAVLRVLRRAFGKNVLCAVKRIFYSRNAQLRSVCIFCYKFFCFFFDCRIVKFKHCVRKRVKPFFNRNHAARLFLFLKRRP